MELTWYEDGRLTFAVGERALSYPRTSANQLILCARMNDWDRFIALWKKKTDAVDWTPLETAFGAFDAQQKWKLKEAFARLTTVDAEVPASDQPLRKISLP